MLMIATLVVFLAAPAFLPSFSITLLNYVGIYSLVAIGLALLTGICGIVSFGQAAFVGVAAYSTAWVSVIQGQSVWLGLLLAIAMTCAVAAIIGFITLRLQGHFLSLSTVAWGLAIGFLFGNLAGLGNFNGLANIPPISIGRQPLIQGWQMFYLIWTIVLVSLLLLGNLLDSRIGRSFRTLRGGTTLVESLGISAFHARLTAFVLAALLCALSGWLYAHLSRFISPAPFEAGAGIEYLMMAMVGGTGTIVGGVAGSALVTYLKNAIQDYLPLLIKHGSGQLELVVFSALFILFLQRARQGIVPFFTRFVPAVKVEKPVANGSLARREQYRSGTQLLQINKLVRKFGGLVAVNDVTFEIRAGEILALIGPNGAGKSTLFNLVTGALRTDAGEVFFCGRSLARQSQAQIARAGIARTFQHVKLRPGMTLLDNVLLGAYPRTRAGVLGCALRLDREEEAKATADALNQLDRVGLGRDPFQLAGSLALGNQRILEIARALAADPVLLVLDEPAAGLRRHEKQRLAELLKSLRGEGVTIFLVEHDMEFVMNLADRVVVMEFGSKLCEGTPTEIVRNPRVQEAYLGVGL
nr:branched-chain amino acid ABC transporter ATP-binding protein/permease [Bradyrhizobium sp. CCBAU 53338]